ncbi:MAG: SDR family oxidoreductase [Balneolaceae bacterium]|nr:SDR family oxidoreductase [Balneolaceae bacterium]
MKLLVTGTSRGIGYSIAEKFLEEGHEVVGTSRSEIPAFNIDNYQHIQCDLALESDLAKLMSILQGDKLPEVLINNAGMFAEADFDINDTEWIANWDKTMQVNLRAPALLCKWALNAWNKQHIGGRIINVSSRAGYRGDTQEYASYAASKGGLIAFTKSIARSYGKYGVTAYSIAPGFVDTDMARESIEVYGAEYLTKDLALDSIAPPEQIAEIVYLLAEGKLTHATGQTFHINSGSYLV